MALERRGQNGAASRMLTDGLGAVALRRSCLKGTSLAELSADCLETANEVLAVGPPPPLGMGWHELLEKSQASSVTTGSLPTGDALLGGWGDRAMPFLRREHPGAASIRGLPEVC